MSTQFKFNNNSICYCVGCFKIIILYRHRNYLLFKLYVNGKINTDEVLTCNTNLNENISPMETTTQTSIDN